TPPVLEASGGAVAPNRSVERLVGAYPGTCHPARDGGLECVSSVAVWQGRLRDGEIDLRRVRRTLGVMLMREGAMSAAPSGDRIVIGIPEVRNPRIATVRQGLAAALTNLAARPIAGVAVADASQATGDLRVDIELRDLVLGRLTSAKVAATSEYISRYEDKANPAYDIANAAAIRARGERDGANAAYQAELTQFESNKKVCEMAGQQVKKMAGGGVLGSLVGAAGEAGCGMALSPSTDGIVKAETAVATAEATLATTPRTVQSPVMAPWTYEKTTYRRAVAVKVVLKIQDTKTNAVETRTFAVEHAWDDYSAARDEAHNVEGHDVPAPMLADADGLLPALAAKVEASARAAVSQRIVELGLSPARTALASSFATTKDDQLVDSSAYLVARERLRAALAHGEARVSGDKSVTVQLGSFATQSNGCVLVVALPSDLSKRVKISAKGNSIADQRGVVPAYIEACGSAAELGSIELASDGDATVRWGAYATSIFDTTIAATNAP
ncbi:MAG TPA: hypothetical protein VLC93_13675, partial [Myxococcota bacterium]|nr:hypothetical protein [Myxococcota bacterium]